MVTYASGSIRIGQLGSDTDWDAMIENLMKVESRQVTQLMRWKEDWKIRLDAFQQIRSELMNLQSALSGLNSLNKFLAKNAASSDDKVATATADADSMNMSYDLVVNQKATYSSWIKDTGLKNKNDVICQNGGSITYTYKGKTRTVDIVKETTVEGLIKKINNDSKNPGVRAQMIQSVDGISLQLRGMDTGKSNTLIIQETVGIDGLDVSLTNKTYDEVSESEIISESTFADPAVTLLNPNPGTLKSFVYTLDGTRYTVDVDDDDTLDELVTKINANHTYTIASVEPKNGEYALKLEKPDTSYTFTPSSTNTNTILADILNGKEFNADTDTILNTGDPAIDVILRVDSSDGSEPHNEDYTISSIDDTTTLRDLANELQFRVGGAGKVAIVPSPNDPAKWVLKIDSTDKAHRVSVEDGTLADLAYVPPTDPSWDVQQGVNAQVRINGYPSGQDAYGQDKWLECASNTLKSGEVIPGVTFNLLSTGTADIAVSTDSGKIEENVVAFVDAVNAFRTLLRSFTEYDEEKQTLDLEYAESQFEMQKGGVLMGNYGIQTIESRLKTCIAASAVGFLHREYDTDGSIIGGEIFSSLSQIGITTNAVEGDVNYGLLEINMVPNAKGSMSFADALAEDPEAVARLFALKDYGKSNSDYFHYNSHIATITKPGTYNVSYTVAADGTITGTINGKAASYDAVTKQLTATGDGPARGLMVDIAERTAGSSYSGTVSIQTGKVNEMLGLLEGTQGILGSGGTLKNLEKNYRQIISGIEEKITREDTRLAKWERTMIDRFSRLEATLANYKNLQASLESQIAKLNSTKAS